VSVSAVASAVPLGGPASRVDTDLERDTMKRVGRRTLPFVFVLYIFNFLDRSNVGLAALQMNKDLGFSSRAFGLGAGIFFIGYALFEVPSNLLLVKVGARRWIARIMITWGIIAVGMMFVRTPMQFYVLRFLLGVAEAGFFPAIIYYLSQWFPASMRARSMAKFMIAIPLSGLLGGPLGGWLLGFDGRMGLQGWQWLFLVEGIPSVLLGVITLRYLTERPEQAQWLSPAQRIWLTTRLEQDQREHPADHRMPPLRALLHPLIWLAALPELLVTTAGYAYLFWGPTLIREQLKTSNVMTGLITGGVAILCAAAMLIAGASSDRKGERTGHAAFCAALVTVGCLGAAFFNDPVARFASLVLMQVSVIAFLAPFWCIPTLVLSGSSAAVGIALVNAIGNVGGFIGPNAIGFFRNSIGGDTGAFIGLALMSGTAALIIFFMGRSPLLARRSAATS
jgi:MFS transporter, ACS family, tartrate transporter